jgi:DNA polymerase elongation subunit (family B)
VIKALKLVLNGSYGAFATSYFILYNNHVAGTITAQGRDLTRTMDKVNEDYWYNQWQNDHELHFRLGIKDVTQINRDQPVSIYADTDSLFVSFKPAMDHCLWKNLIFNSDYLENITEKFIVLCPYELKFNNSNCIGVVKDIYELKNIIDTDHSLLLFDGSFVKDRGLQKLISSEILNTDIYWNWSAEQDFIHGVDFLRFGQYFKDCLENYANSFGVENKEDFELERISESIINIAKKKYICHITYEDGIPFERLSYLYPKGVELVRSSTPAFAREKIVNIVKYLFTHPDSFNIKDLLRLVKNLRKEFELADIDDISMQSSCSNYDVKVLNDKSVPLQFVSGAHFAVKSAAHYNYLLSGKKEWQQKYEFIKSGTKIKYYVCKDKSITDMFAYIRGSFPMEFAPPIDYDTQFQKSILSPVNSIIEPLGMPEITKRLSVVMDIFSGFN